MSTKKTDVQLKVTPIAALKKYADTGTVVELPGWEEGVPFCPRLRRSSLRLLVTAGKIPNSLLGAAQRLYEGGNSKATAKFSDSLEVMRLVVEDSMAEPTLAELKDIGVELTEEQFGLIFMYAQNGIQVLESFRKEQRSADGDRDGEDVEGDAKQPAGH